MKKSALYVGLSSDLSARIRDSVLKIFGFELGECPPSDRPIATERYKFIFLDTRSWRSWKVCLNELVRAKEKVVVIFSGTHPRTAGTDYALRHGAAAVVGDEDSAEQIRTTLENAEVLPRREHCPLIATMKAGVFGGSATVRLTARVVSPPGVLHTVAQALREDAPVLVLVEVSGTSPRYPHADVVHNAVDYGASTFWLPADATGLVWSLQLMVKEGSAPCDVSDARTLVTTLVKKAMEVAWDCDEAELNLGIVNPWVHPGVGDQET